jgi:hypothetical protein
VPEGKTAARQLPEEITLKAICNREEQGALGIPCFREVIDLSPPSDYLLSDTAAAVNQISCHDHRCR